MLTTPDNMLVIM